MTANKLLQTFILLLSLSVCNVSAAEDWTLEKSESNYRLYSQNFPGSKFLQVKAEITFPAPTDKVLNYFGSGDQCWQWQNRCDSTKVLEQLSESEQIVHVVVDMPWPISDRDFLIHSQKRINKDSGVFELSLSPAKQAELETDYVRGKSNNRYLLTPVEENKSKLIITRHTEFGGEVSAKLINPRMIKEFEKDVKSLIKLVHSGND